MKLASVIPTTLFVVRHGETLWNAEGRLQGYKNSDLNARGVLQAEAVGRALAGEQIEHIYASDLGRAQQTAAAIARHCNLAPGRSDPRLRERCMGIFEGLTRSELAARHADLYLDYREAGPDFVIPEGESARQRFDRSVTALKEIAATHSGGRIVVVTHGGVLNGFMRFALDIPLAAPRKFMVYNCAINIFLATDGLFKLGTWGSTAHLGPIGAIDDP